jgi:hypothetical protein
MDLEAPKMMVFHEGRVTREAPSGSCCLRESLSLTSAIVGSLDVIPSLSRTGGSPPGDGVRVDEKLTDCGMVWPTREWTNLSGSV